VEHPSGQPPQSLTCPFEQQSPRFAISPAQTVEQTLKFNTASLIHDNILKNVPNPVRMDAMDCLAK
jgi:hypothetical protein